MLELALFAVVLVLLCIAVVKHFITVTGSPNPCTVPGLGPATRKDGNLEDIKRAGSLHQFLIDLHKRFGPIASFWFGPTFAVSICDAKLFHEHQHVFDRPEVMFLSFLDLIGPKSIQYANGSDGRARRKLYDQVMTHDACKKYFLTFQREADDLEKKLMTLATDEHVPLTQYMMGYALKCTLKALFGHALCEEKVLEFWKLYAIVWTEMELRATTKSTPDREKRFTEALKKLQDLILGVVEDRRSKHRVNGEETLVDLLIDNVSDEEVLKSDSITFIVGGFHTTGYGLTWCFYFLATHPECQEKIYTEITEVLKGEDQDHTNIGELVYLRQVLDETLRCSTLAPYAARYQDVDSVLGGYEIPKNTPVIHGLGVSQVDEELWPEPLKFDPERFSPKNSKRRPIIAFSPFGFAGKRMCPAHRFVYVETTVLLVTLLRKFKVNMVEGQVIEKVHGLVTHPSDEIWITLQKR